MHLTSATEDVTVTPLGEGPSAQRLPLGYPLPAGAEEGRFPKAACAVCRPRPDDHCPGARLDPAARRLMATAPWSAHASGRGSDGARSRADARL